MIEIAICDDEVTVVHEIEALVEKMCQKYCVEANVETFLNGRQLESAFLKKQFDLLYLDIQMQGFDGIHTAEAIRRINNHVLLIYVSGYTEYVEEVFTTDAIGFVKKPIEEKSFDAFFSRAMSRLQNKGEVFEYVYKTQSKRVLLEQILYLESKGRKIEIHLENGQVESFNGKIRDIEKELMDVKANFIRSHQSFLVNYNAIQIRSYCELTLVNGDTVPISRERQKIFREQYCMLQGGNLDE